MIDTCPIFLNLIPDNPIPTTPINLEEDDCSCNCKCGYLLFESLIPFLDELQDAQSRDPESYKKIEAKLRQQITEVSRLFDAQVGVKPGFFSKGHLGVREYHSNGRYIEVQPFVKDSLEVFYMNGVPVDPNSYGIEGQVIVHHPCVNLNNCGCTGGFGGCSNTDHFRIRNNWRMRQLQWPSACYKIKARWGFECADEAVQLAIRQYLIELYRKADPVTIEQSGFPSSTKFQVPHAWTTLVNAYTRRYALRSRIAIS